MVKLCSDCDWQKFKNHLSDLGRRSERTLMCGHPKNINGADGGPKWTLETQRSATWLQAVIIGFCGESGRWWKPKSVEAA